MKTSVALLFIALTICCGYTCPAQDDFGVPLAEAITESNERIQTLDQRILPLTEKELFVAIDQWDRQEQPVSDEQLANFQRLKKTRTLKPGDSLHPSLSWQRDGMEGTTETLTAKFQLDLMTGEQEGFRFVVRRQHLEQRPYPPTTAGYEWFVRPEPLKTRNGSSVLFDNALVYSVETDPGLSVTISRLLVPGGGLYDLQPVAFDAAGVRHTFREQRIGQSGNLRMSKYVLQDVATPVQNIDSVGLEMLTRFGAEYLSRKSLDAATRTGSKVLPLPIVGKPLQFEFNSSSGQTIRSSELLGNIVLIDCWATWCGPCVRKIPALKQLHEEYASSGLKVIGLSFDSDPKKAEAVYESRQVPWPLIHVPADEETRRLWDQSARIDSLPRILVLNTAGVLESDTDSLPIAIDTIRSLLQKGGEPSHALEPAARPDSNGESSPPAQ